MLTTVLVSVALTFCLLTGAGGAWALIVSARSPRKQTTEVQPTGYLQELAARITAVELMVKGLPSLWEEERERTLKFANRAYASEKRTRELLAGDEDFEGDEDEDQRVLELNAIRSEEAGVHPLRSDLDGPLDAGLMERAAASLARGF